MIRNFLLLFLLSTTSGYAQEFGIVIDSVVCETDPSQTYSLYVPKEYNEDREWPIMYFFEPAARGSLPVKLYSELADEYGLILASSNNSKNGPLVQGDLAYAAMRADTEARFKIDQDRIYTSGFSGGGRFAHHLAANNEEVDGVIAVAGPKSDYSLTFPTAGDNLDYVGIVGSKDMNFREHRDWNTELRSRGVSNALVLYDAGHQWPPAKEYRKTLDWMAAKQFPDLRASYVSGEMKTIDSLMSANRWEADRLLRELQFNFPTEFATTDGEKHLKTLKSDKKLSKEKSRELKNLEIEKREQMKLLEALREAEAFVLTPGLVDSTTYTTEWWRREVSSMRVRSEKGDAKALMNARLLDQLRGYLYGVAIKADQIGHMELSFFVNDIYLSMYPESVWFLWKRSILFAKKGSKREALKHLELAMKKDEENLRKFQSRPEFQELRTTFPFLFDQ